MVGEAMELEQYWSDVDCMEFVSAETKMVVKAMEWYLARKMNLSTLLMVVRERGMRSSCWFRKFNRFPDLAFCKAQIRW